MGKKVYVDAISQDGSVATVKDQRVIAYNLFKLGRNEKVSSPMFSAGVYACILTVDEMGVCVMTFIDYRANPNFGALISKSITDNSTFETQFNNLAELINVNYEARKGEIEIIKGFPPEIVVE